MSDFYVFTIVILSAVALSVLAVFIIHLCVKFFTKHRPHIVIYKPKHKKKMQKQQK